jgi:CysZ protein
MLSALRKAAADLLHARLRGIVWRALAVTALMFAIVCAAAAWGLHQFQYVEWAWADAALKWLGSAAVVAGAVFLFPVTFPVLQSLFLDAVADRVEAHHYPHLGPPRGTPFMAGLWSGLRVVGLMIVVNLLFLPLYLLLTMVAGTGFGLYYAVNGWLCGREYHTQIALRRMAPREVAAHRHGRRSIIWLGGIAITLMGTVPLLNLVAPVLGCALMTHLLQRGAPKPARE